MARLLRQWGDKIEFVVVGYLTLPKALQPFRSQIRMFEPIWDVETYWQLLRDMDISIAVLKPGLIADCKSEIKWLEAAMLGVPSVVTATQTYREVVEHDVTGLLVTQPDDWYVHLDALIEDAPRRRSIGQAAREEVLRRYSVPTLAANIRRIMDAVAAEPKTARTKILIVNVFFAPQSIGGATRVVEDNVRDLLAHHSDEFELQLFCTFEGGAEPYLPLVYDFEGVRVTAISTPFDADVDSKPWDDRMARHFEAVVNHFGPDLVHFHCIQRITLSVCAVLRRNHIPYIVTVHDGWSDFRRQFLIDEYGTAQCYAYGDPLRELTRGGSGRLERMRLKREYLLAAGRVLAVSEPFGRIYRDCGFDNVSVVANGVSDLNVLPRRPRPTAAFGWLTLQAPVCTRGTISSRQPCFAAPLGICTC